MASCEFKDGAETTRWAGTTSGRTGTRRAWIRELGLQEIMHDTVRPTRPGSVAKGTLGRDPRRPDCAAEDGGEESGLLDTNV